MSLSTAILLANTDSLTAHVKTLHDRLMESFPAIDRMACALYDAETDVLSTFINSTRTGIALSGYEYKLADSYSLSALAKSKQTRVLDNIPAQVKSQAEHAKWVSGQGYSSSFTVPMYFGDDFLGFVFFDSLGQSAFTPKIQVELLLYCSLISMAIINQIAAVQTLMESVRVARDLTEVRDFETGKHLERMARYSRLIAKSLSNTYNLSDEYIESIYLFSPLHDIGKIGIPDKILLKPGKLESDERRIMETHVEKGINIIQRITNHTTYKAIKNSSILLNIVGCHHEYLDGTGYPKGLTGDQIPIEAQIIVVADIYDALTSIRPYKKPWGQEDALKELTRMAEAGKINKKCVQALRENHEQVSEIQNIHRDNPEKEIQIN